MNNFEYYGLTKKGVRVENQDNFIVFQNKYKFLIAAVADGMGGHQGGKYASTITVKLIEYMFKDVNFENMVDKEIEKFLLKAISEIQNYLISETTRKDLSKDMGTTLNLNIIVRNKLYTLNIGDSRAFHFYKKTLLQISEDHNLAALAKKDPAFARFENFTNYLTSALGPKKDSKVDIFVTTLQKDSYIVITSDGVHNYVNGEKITKILKSKNTIQQKVEEIVDSALTNGSTDNVTCITVKNGN